MTVAALASDLIRATVKHGYPAHGAPFGFFTDDVVRASDLLIVSDVSLDEGDDYQRTTVATENYLQVTAVTADGLTSEVIWAVGLGEAINLLSADLTVDF